MPDEAVMQPSDLAWMQERTPECRAQASCWPPPAFRDVQIADIRKPGRLKAGGMP
jgi:hypothetical protein